MRKSTGKRLVDGSDGESGLVTASVVSDERNSGEVAASDCLRHFKHWTFRLGTPSDVGNLAKEPHR